MVISLVPRQNKETKRLPSELVPGGCAPSWCALSFWAACLPGVHSPPLGLSQRHQAKHAPSISQCHSVSLPTQSASALIFWKYVSLKSPYWKWEANFLPCLALGLHLQQEELPHGTGRYKAAPGLPGYSSKLSIFPRLCNGSPHSLAAVNALHFLHCRRALWLTPESKHGWSTKQPSDCRTFLASQFYKCKGNHNSNQQHDGINSKEIWIEFHWIICYSEILLFNLRYPTWLFSAHQL